MAVIEYDEYKQKLQALEPTLRELEKALGILRFSTRHSSRDLEKLLLSAMSNWQAKNEGQKADEAIGE